MHILELRPDSEEVAELLEFTAAAHGPWVKVAAPLMMRMWLMRSAWAPGLHFVGGLARPFEASWDGIAPLSVGGTGLQIEDAFAGCLAEAVERTSQVERDGDVVLSAPLSEVRIPDQLGELIELLIAQDGAAAHRVIDWVRGQDATSSAEVLVPADWCLRRSGTPTFAIPGAALSTGCAAAATADDALSRGLLELVERDAASLWWLGGRPAAALASDSSEAEAARRLNDGLRGGDDLHRTTRVLDISSDIPIPVMVAVAHGDDGKGLAIGLAARLSPTRAAGSALIELCQMELGLQFASGKLEQLGDEALTDADRGHLARASVFVSDLMPLTALEAPRRPATTGDAVEATGSLAAILARAEVQAWQVDLTRPEQDLAVIKTIAPRLQAMPGDLVTARLSSIARGQIQRPSVRLM